MVDVAYVDTSVFVKLFDEREAGAPALSRRMEETLGAASALLLPEAMSAVARKSREGRFDRKESESLRRRVRDTCTRLLRVALTSDVMSEAERLLFAHTLRAGDAVHLASAILLRRTRDGDLPLLTADRSMVKAARAEGLVVETYGLDGSTT